MDVQTQIVDESGLANEVNSNARVAGFKQNLAENRAFLVTLVQEYQALSETLRTQIQSNEDTIGLFKAEAYKMYPELITQNIDEVLKNISAAHPLAQLWSKYQQKVGAGNTAIQVTVGQMNEKKALIAQAEAQEKSLLDSYAMFARFSATPVPSAEQLKAEIDAEAVIPRVEEGSTVASIPALELLDPEAADMVTLQAVKMAEQAEYEEAVARGEMSPDDVRVTMLANQGMPVMAAEQGVDPTGLTDKQKKYVMYGGAALLVYFLFLRRN